MALAEAMSRELQLPVPYILRMAKSASHLYKEYQIPKRDGGQRTIHHPSKELKALQRWLVRRCLERLPIHPSAVAYRKGMSVLQNAQPHVHSRYLLRMDLQEFFPSLTADSIRNYIGANPQHFEDWTESDVLVFCSLVCRHGRLAIGAPSSPTLSNVLCWKLDNLLSLKAGEREVTYTRYADDLFFSSRRAGVLGGFEEEVRSCVEGLDLPSGLRIKAEKTRHSSKRGQRRVTGVVLGSKGELSLGRNIKRKVKSLVFRVDGLESEDRKRLAGLLGYCQMIEPDFLNRLILKYGVARVSKAQGRS